MNGDPQDSLKDIGLFDWTGGIVNRRNNPIAYPQNALWDGENVDISDKWLKTRLGYSACVSSPILADSTIERIFHIHFPSILKSYVICQARSSTQCKIYASNTNLPSSNMSFTEIYDLGTSAGSISVATLNDRCVITEGKAAPPLVFLGGMTSNGSDWVYPKQIFCTINGTDFFDMTEELCDNDPDTVLAIPALPAEGGIYVCCDVPTLTGFYFEVISPNVTTASMIIEKFSGGSWVPLSITDNTATAGVTLSKSGTVTFPAATSDYYAVAEVPGFWFRIKFSLIAGATAWHYAVINESSDIVQTNWAGSITNWHKDDANVGTFRDSSDNPVAVGTGTDVVVGSLVTFADESTATITGISGDGTTAGSVVLSSDHASGSISKIERGLVTAAGLGPNFYDGADGAANPSEDYATADMTSNSTPSPNVVSASSFETYAGWRAFDQVNDEYCWKTSGSTGWIKIDLGSEYIVNKYLIQARNAVSDRGFPKDWTLQGSNDDLSWTTLHTVTGAVDPGQGLWSSPYTFTNAIPYRYYKLEITDKNGTGELAIGELRLVKSPMATPSQICVGRSTDDSHPDISSWTRFYSATITQTTPSSSTCYHAVSFDGRSTWRIYKSSTWRIIASYNLGTWQYNNGTILVNCPINSEHAALKAAFSVAANQWTKSDIEAMAEIDWEKTGGYIDAASYMDWAIGAKADVDEVAVFDKISIAGAKVGTAALDIASTSDVTLTDLRGDIAYWNRGATSYKGRFEGAEVAFGNDDVTDEGGGKTGFPAVGHGLSAGDKVRFYGFTESTYNATHIVDAATTTDKIVVAITYVAETMSSSCKRRKVISVGTGKNNEDVEAGCAVVFADATYIVRGVSGDGTDPDAGIWLSGDHADADITAIYAMGVSSGLLRTLKTVIEEPANPDGAYNPNTSYMTPAMTSNTTPYPYVVTQSLSGSQNYRAFDQTDASPYDQNNNYPHLTIDLGAGNGKVCNKYDIFNKTTPIPTSSWQLKGSNDGSTWTVLDTRTSYTWAYNGWIGQNGALGAYFTFTNSTAYRYYRLSWTGGSSFCIAELKLVESKDATYTYIPQQCSVATSNAGIQIDCSTWDYIVSCSVSQTTSGTSAAYHAISFDGRATYKVFYSEAWREIAKNDSGTWKYNDSTTSTPNWVASPQNNRQYALRKALSVSQNRMTGAALEAITESQWQSTGGFSPSVNTIDIAIGLTGGTDVASVDKYTFVYRIDTSATFEPTNVTSDFSVHDVKNTIAKWEKGASGTGRFTTSAGAPVSIGPGNTNADIEKGLLVTFSDSATRTITEIIGDGTAAGSVTLSEDHASGDINSIKGLVFSSGAVTHNSYGDPDGSHNTSVTSVTQPMTSDNTPSPLVATSSTEQDYKPWKAFNQSNTDEYDCWKSGIGVTTGWLKFYFGTGNAKAINKYYIKTSTIASAEAPSSWTLQGSNNDSSWTTLDSRSWVTDPGPDAWLGPYTFSNTTPYLYYRLNITASNGTRITIGEVKLVESSPVQCNSEVVAYGAATNRITPDAISHVISVSCTETTPTGTSVGYILSFDEGATWKIYSSGWKEVAKLDGAQWKYNRNLSSPTWVDASPNTQLEALRNAYTMTGSQLVGLSSTQWESTGGFTPGHTIDIAYSLLGTETSRPVTSVMGIQTEIDPTYIVTSLSKLTFQAPCQPLQNIHESGTGDLVMGCVTYQAATNKSNDYAVDVSDGSLTTGAAIGGMTSSDYLYIGGVEKFVTLLVTMGNNYQNSNTAALSGEYWDGKEWKTLSGFADGTSSGGKCFAQRGEISWTSPDDWRENKPINYSLTMGYWIRLKVSATLSSNVMIAEVRITSQPEPLVKHKFALSFSNRMALANRPDARDQVDISRPYEEYGFTGSNSVSIRVGGQDQILSVIKSYDQMWLTKLEDWYQITSDSFSSLDAPRGEAAAQAPINDTCICLAPIDKYGKSQIGPIADAKNKQGVYYLNHNGAWCFTGAELFKLGEWVTWWDKDAENPKLDRDYLHQSCATFWAFKNWLIWAVPLITGTHGAQTTNNYLMVYDITNGVWLPFFNISAASLCQARAYQANAPSTLGEVVLLAGGYDGKVYRLFPPDATTDNGSAINSWVETGWLSFGAPHVEKQLRAVYTYANITSGEATLEIRLDGEATASASNIFTLTSLSPTSSQSYLLDFAHRNVIARSFKFKISWSGPGSLFGFQLQLASVRDWPGT
jgi:hypothetical protein